MLCLFLNRTRIPNPPTINPTESIMNVKTNVKAGPTPIYMSINDTGLKGR